MKVGKKSRYASRSPSSIIGHSDDDNGRTPPPAGKLIEMNTLIELTVLHQNEDLRLVVGTVLLDPVDRNTMIKLEALHRREEP